MSDSQLTTPAPTIRVRINHEQTAKGWRTRETTVEVEWLNQLDPSLPFVVGGIGGDPAYGTEVGIGPLLADLLRAVEFEARAETDRRNALDYPAVTP